MSLHPRFAHHRLSPLLRHALLTTALACSGALAHDHLQLSGFGSVAYSHDDGRDIGFMRDITQPVPPDRDGSWRSDSILGLQAAYRFSPTLEAVSQAVLRHRVDYKPRSIVEWAFVAWRPNEHLDLRAGRMGVDVFLLSDYRNVGYAQPWIRPPREFYGWIPLGSVDGIDAAWKFDLAGMRWTAKAQFGRSATEVPLTEDDSFRFRVDRLRDLTLLAERNAWQFKAGYAAFRMGSQPDFGPVQSGLDQIAGLKGTSNNPRFFRNSAAK